MYVFVSRTIYRRVSSGAAGSMTVEAALVVPLFILCVINLLFGLQVVETSSRITAALHETSNNICSYGYAIEHGVGEGVPSGIGSTVYAISSVSGHLGETVERRGGIRGGKSGLNYLGSSVLTDGGLVKLSVTYALKFPVDMGIKTYRLGTSVYSHAWVGYDGAGGITDMSEEDPIVYVTRTGTVYHTDMNCRYLNPSTRSVAASSVDGLRNHDGCKYYACEICGAGSGIGSVYVTDYGTRYHSDLYCSGIRRDIQAIHLSEAGGRGPCSICGGW
ncbi:hypothetical protein SAMN02910292_01028 [Lachnospiraceae bacterium XBB2008]|nr:hypothetical protein SAMN02910292_01028 [Lachnospiraceae bacterium XBB2008]